ncbi:MAG TPA: hypothetical protein VFO16_09350 [Pseudonocardiaceae bacterium]|nr:hypothetical protein [Pseudonocardiaceae bacterium]
MSLWVFPRDDDGLTRTEREAQARQHAPLHIPAGFGMRSLDQTAQQQAWREVGDEPCPTDCLLVWEAPRKGHRYVVSADISSGQKLDYSVADVTRVSTLREPAEQVAQFRTNTIDESDFAYILDAIGRLYHSGIGGDDQHALVAVETNAMGVSTVRELTKHIGYTNVFIWKYWDVADDKDQSRRFGWTTSQRSRPIMLQHYVHLIRQVDPHTGWPDYRVNSPATIEELSAFQSPGPLWMAEAVDGAHDDCVMAGAIGQIVIKLEYESLGETMHDRRRRTGEEVARAEAQAERAGRAVDFQNSDATYDQMMGREDDWTSMDADSLERVHLYTVDSVWSQR